MQQKIMASASENAEIIPEVSHQDGNVTDDQNIEAGPSDHQPDSKMATLAGHKKALPTPFDFSPIQASLPGSCDSVPQCGALSSSCTSVFSANQLPEGAAPFNLSMRVKGIFGTENRDVFSNALCGTPLEQNEKSCKSSYSSKPASNFMPSDTQPSMLNTECGHKIVVMTQPSAGRLLTNACGVMTTPSSICVCVNPGTSHACASRMYHRSSLGVLNPLFDQVSCTSHEIHRFDLNTPRRFSLDSVLKSKGLDLPEYPVGPMALNMLSPLPKDLAADVKEPFIASSASVMPKMPSISESSISYGGIESSIPKGNASGQTPLIKGIPTEAYSGNLSDMGTVSGMCHSSQGQLQTVLSPNWFSTLTPSPDAYAQKLFSPEDLRDELLYPTPYGISSEVYQNINAREADFILLKPTRKPRMETVPPSSVHEGTHELTKPSELDENPKEASSSGEEISLKEGDTGSQRNSLIERRKSSLEKIFIPPTKEQIKPILDIKVDNFDRDEYITFKKRLSVSDALAFDMMKTNVSSYPIKPFSLPLETKADAVLSMPQYPSDLKKKKLPKSEIQKQNKANVDKQSEKKFSEKNTFNANHISRISKASVSDKNSKEFENTSSKRYSNERQSTPQKNMPSLKDQQWNDEFIFFKSQLSARRNFRKQSLPTEELFSNRCTRPSRKPSLNPLLDYQDLQKMSHKSAAFSPVRELDENFCSLNDESSKRKPISKRHSIANPREERNLMAFKDSPYDSLERRKLASRQLNQKMSSSSLPEEPRKSKGRSRSRRDKKSSSHAKSGVKDSSHKSHHRHTQEVLSTPEKAQNKSSHRVSQEDTASGKKHRNVPQCSSSKKSLKKNEHLSKTTHRSSISYTSPLGPGYEVNSPEPIVPYERLEESRTPTQVKNLPLFAGGARKENVHRRPKRRQPLDGDLYLSSSSSSKSSSSSRSNSKGSKSSSSSSSDATSSSSSSDSSDSESTSSSSSSSSSSDSSDIQDLIL